jgi:hypothetical protein
MAVWGQRRRVVAGGTRVGGMVVVVPAAAVGELNFFINFKKYLQCVNCVARQCFIWFRKCLLCAKFATRLMVRRAFRENTKDKGPLPCKNLPCGLCRAWPRKTHSKGFAVRFLLFAVRPKRTANSRFPVVIHLCQLYV